jgi:sec-independent protein translocase protein TatA
MPIKFGPPELLIIFGIVVLLFGVGRLGRIGGELGSAIRQFREGIGSGKDEEPTAAADDKVKVEETK